jgi:hypothetical protein
VDSINTFDDLGSEFLMFHFISGTGSSLNEIHDCTAILLR